MGGAAAAKQAGSPRGDLFAVALPKASTSIEAAAVSCTLRLVPHVKRLEAGMNTKKAPAAVQSFGASLRLDGTSKTSASGI